MIERMDDVPEGVIGFRATGEVTADEYKDVLVPAIHAAVDEGEVRFLYVIGPGFDGMKADAYLQDAKLGAWLELGHLKAWKRTAIVTDVEWISKSVQLFAWMVPGEVKVCGLDDLDEAREWVAAED